MGGTVRIDNHFRLQICNGQQNIWCHKNNMFWENKTFLFDSVSLSHTSNFSSHLRQPQCDHLVGKDQSLRATRARATATSTAATTTSTTATRPATSTAAATTSTTRVLRVTPAQAIAGEIQAAYTGGR